MRDSENINTDYLKKEMEENKSIEENFEELENIITKMQSDEITLENSFELYNKGLGLVQNCNSQIEKIEKQIKVIEEGNINE